MNREMKKAVLNNKGFMKNPGKKNREERREFLNSERGERVASTRVREDKRRKRLERAWKREFYY